MCVCIYILKKGPKRINVTSNTHTHTQHTLYIRDVNMFPMLFILISILISKMSNDVKLKKYYFRKYNCIRYFINTDFKFCSNFTTKWMNKNSYAITTSYILSNKDYYSYRILHLVYQTCPKCVLHNLVLNRLVTSNIRDF